uniref:Semaphorin 6C n=1 Tax=Myotis lucifugus TaxID=59463 RepID=G1NZ41_MYOLU
MPRAPYFMPLLLLLLLLSLPHTQATFPRDPLPLLISDLQGTSPLSWFRGLEDDAVVAELGLDFQKFLTLNRTLLVAARDHVFSFDLQAQEEGEGLVPNKYLTWRSQDMENCAVRGKLTDECYNYIRVLVPSDSQTLLACGTNSFSPVCRSYGITSLQQEGEELSGQARCPFDATQSNVAVFAEGSLYSATAADFQASDAVVYRSLGPQPPLRSAKYDSKWLREPHFVHALEHGDHVYFFFREVSVEDTRLGRVQFSRVARVCKRDMGGSPRALDRHWTSFLKLRLNCSVPGDAAFYFDVLQALTGPVNLYGRPALFGVFSTQTNSIPGSAVCAFYLDDIERGFEGKFKEQRSSDGAWTPVSEDRVPSPRPGSCAGVGVAALFPSSRDLPDDVLTFIKAHPLLDPTVPPATHQPLLTLTSRALLTQVAVDGTAGPYRNTTVLFLGSNDGTVLKVLPPGGQSGGREPILLEEINAYSPSRCSGKRAAQTARQVIGLELDTEGHRLFVAFSGCIIYLPLSRCARHEPVGVSCLASQDPYCGWHSSRGCVDIRGPGGTDVDPAGNQESREHGDCQDGATGSQSGTGNSAYGESCPDFTSLTHPILTQLEFWAFGFQLGAGGRELLRGCQRRAGASLALTWSLSPVLLGPGPSPETPSPPSEAHPRPQASTLGAHTQASAARSVPIPLLLACVAARFCPGRPGLQACWSPALVAAPTVNEAPGPARGNAAGGSAPRVLVRPPPRGCPGRAVEVTTLEELLRHLHAPPPAPRALPLEPAPAPSAGSRILPRECAPPLRLDVPPDGQCPRPPGRPAPRSPAGWAAAGGRPFSSHRAPPALLTRVPSGGPSRDSGRHLYLGRPEGYRSRTLKRVDLQKPRSPPKLPPVAAPAPLAVPGGSHFNL